MRVLELLLNRLGRLIGIDGFEPSNHGVKYSNSIDISVEGFEPSMADPNSAVLPLDDTEVYTYITFYGLMHHVCKLH